MIRKCVIIIFMFLQLASLVVAQKHAKPFEKGDLRIDIKLPHVNFMAFQPQKKFKDAELGFNGYGIGLEYSYKNKKFVEVSSSLAMAFALPFPAPVDAQYNKLLSTYYFSITDNIIGRRFTFGYGINYSFNNWREWTRDFDQLGLQTTYDSLLVNKSMGLTLNSYYRVRKNLNLGLIYRPTFYTNSKFNTEHLLSIEVNWRIKLFKIKRN
jgi:hypothetical protein